MSSLLLGVGTDELDQVSAQYVGSSGDVADGHSGPPGLPERGLSQSRPCHGLIQAVEHLWFDHLGWPVIGHDGPLSQCRSDCLANPANRPMDKAQIDVCRNRSVHTGYDRHGSIATTIGVKFPELSLLLEAAGPGAFGFVRYPLPHAPTGQVV